ncbi:hypothetical protein FRC09_008904 [Ceratobasidium sp. 395]|nr:hypothetical protein FRC09_008904 [Ceratobasidium sp. 395]
MDKREYFITNAQHDTKVKYSEDAHGEPLTGGMGFSGETEGRRASKQLISWYFRKVDAKEKNWYAISPVGCLDLFVSPDSVTDNSLHLSTQRTWWVLQKVDASDRYIIKHSSKDLYWTLASNEQDQAVGLNRYAAGDAASLWLFEPTK